MHIVNFAMDFDDETIRQKVENQAYSDIVNRLYRDAQGYISCRYGQIEWRGIVEEKIAELLEERREEIIEEAAKRVADSIQRSKKFDDPVEIKVQL